MSATFNKGSFKCWSFLNEIKPTLIDGGNILLINVPCIYTPSNIVTLN